MPLKAEYRRFLALGVSKGVGLPMPALPGFGANGILYAFGLIAAAFAVGYASILLIIMGGVAHITIRRSDRVRKSKSKKIAQSAE